MSQRKLAKNIGIMSFSVFISRILGLIRDQVMAYFFGTTYLNDAFNVAFNLPNLLRRLFGEGALSAAFVPMYNEIGMTKSKKDQVHFALNVISLTTIVLSILTFIGIVFAPLIIKILYPGLPAQTLASAISLSRIMFPYLFFIGLSSTFIAILNSHDYFFMTGLSSALLNIGMISTILIPAIVFPMEKSELIIWAAWGIFLGGFLQTIINLPYLKKIGYRLKIVISLSGETLCNLWKRFLPPMVGIGIREINLVVDALMASFLPVGSITALGLGNRLMQLPLGIFGISTGTAVLPAYSKQISEKKWVQLSNDLKFATITLSALMIPLTFIIIIIGNDFVRILFQRGVFDSKASQMTYQAFLYYSLGLLFYGLNQTVTPLFYAYKDTKTPVKLAAYMVLLNIVLNFILMRFMQHRGLALSTSITAMVNYLILILLIGKKMPEIKLQGILGSEIKMLIIAFVLFLLFHFLNDLFLELTLFLTIVKGILTVLAFFILFFILSSILKVKYIVDVKNKLWSRLSKR